MERFGIWINGYCSQWKSRNVTHHSKFGRYMFSLFFVNFNETWFEKLVSLLFCSCHFDIEAKVLIKSLSCCWVQSMHICYCFGFCFFLVSHLTQNSLTESVMSRENWIHWTMSLMTCCAFSRMNVHLLNGYSLRYIFHFLSLIGVYEHLVVTLSGYFCRKIFLNFLLLFQHP